MKLKTRLSSLLWIVTDDDLPGMREDMIFVPKRGAVFLILDGNIMSLCMSGNRLELSDLLSESAAQDVEFRLRSGTHALIPDCPEYHQLMRHFIELALKNDEIILSNFELSFVQ